MNHEADILLKAIELENETKMNQKALDNRINNCRVWRKLAEEGRI